MNRTEIRLTSRIPLVMTIAMFLVQVFSPAPPVLFILIVIVGVQLAAYVWVRQIAGNVTLQRQRRYGWAQVGDVIEERFVLDNNTWVPLLWAKVEDFSDLPGYSASRAVGMGAMNSMRWNTEGTCEKRGVYTLGPIRITMGDPFGLYEVTLFHDDTEQFVVYPPIAALPQLMEPRGMDRGAARINVRSLDLTTNASSVRQYVPGDALNRIHWRSTAHRSMPMQESIMVKEYDLEPSGDIWLMVDVEAAVHVGEDMESTEEYAVILAASLANQMLRANHAVGLVVYGQAEPIVIRPQKGSQHLWELLKALAGIHAVGEIPLSEAIELVEPVVGQGMSVALITPSPRSDWINALGRFLRRGVHPTAILLDARSFVGEGDNMPGTVAALADMGVTSRVISQGFTFEHLTQRRHQRPKFRVLGTGRVVVSDPGTTDESRWVPVGQREEGGAE